MADKPGAFDKADIDKRRRDLYAISLGLLLFNLAGGSLKNDASVFFGAISITRTWLLLLGAWIAWAYFLWQFWLAARPLWTGYRADVDAELQQSPQYREYCKKLFELIATEAADAASAGPAKQYFGALNRDSLKNIERIATARATEGQVFRLRPGSRGRKFIESDCVHSDGRASDYNFPGLESTLWEHLLSIHPWRESTRLRSIVPARFISAFRRHEFSNRILPLATAMAAVAIQVARAIVQVCRP